MDYDDRGLLAMPKLVGGPKYSRPPVTGFAQSERPPDPDDLPLVAARTPEEHELARELGLDPSAVSGSAVAVSAVGEAATGPHPNGAWSMGEGAARRASATSARLGIGGLLRGRGSRPGAR